MHCCYLNRASSLRTLHHLDCLESTTSSRFLCTCNGRFYSCQMERSLRIEFLEFRLSCACRCQVSALRETLRDSVFQSSQANSIIFSSVLSKIHPRTLLSYHFLTGNHCGCSTIDHRFVLRFLFDRQGTSRSFRADNKRTQMAMYTESP